MKYYKLIVIDNDDIKFEVEGESYFALYKRALKLKELLDVTVEIYEVIKIL
jgi:hypothetical protein